MDIKKSQSFDWDFLNLVPREGIEPSLLSEPDFESGASTNSTTSASDRHYAESPMHAQVFFTELLLFHRAEHHFAQFHAPLIEAVDVPHHALQEGFVLIQGNQRTQCVRREVVQMQS